MFLFAITLAACETDDLPESNLQSLNANIGLFDLYIYDVNSNTNTRITDSPDILESSYSFSPDSRKILFNAGEDVYTMNIDGSEITLLIANLSSPAWSPDGKKIVYVNDGDDLFLTNADGTNPLQLTHSNIGFWKPIWSQNGEKIACSSDNGLSIVTLEGNVKHISNENSATWYDWSADAKTLIYSKFVTGNYTQIFKYDTEEGIESQLTDLNKYNYDPFWNPKKDKIIFTSSHADYGSDLILMNSDGSNQKTLIHKNRINSPSWSPDGEHITFITDDSNLAIIDINGDNYRVVNEVPTACSEPVWSPNGKYILYYRAIFGI